MREKAFQAWWGDTWNRQRKSLERGAQQDYSGRAGRSGQGGAGKRPGRIKPPSFTGGLILLAEGATGVIVAT